MSKVASLKSIREIDDIVLGISHGSGNSVFTEFAQKLEIRSIFGDEHDVLSRLVECGKASGATDIFRVTSESPFIYFQQVSELWVEHVTEKNDATFLDNIIDGCGFEIISMEALESLYPRKTAII